MQEHPIQGLMKTAMENIKEMVDVNTIIGDPVQTHDGTTIIPISRVSFGFAAGGSDFENGQQEERKGKKEETARNRLVKQKDLIGRACVVLDSRNSGWGRTSFNGHSFSTT